MKGSKENGWAVAITAVALLVAAAAILVPNRASLLPATVGAATIAYSGFAWRLVRSAEFDRRDRREAEGRRNQAALAGVLTELQHNAARRGTAAEAYHAIIPFERSALDRVREYVLDLPDQLREALQEVELTVARYNALANFHNHHATLYGDVQAKLRETFGPEALRAIDKASPELASYLKASVSAGRTAHR